MLRTLAPWVVVLAVSLTACGDDDDDDTPDANTDIDAAALPIDATPPGPGLTITGTLIADNASNSEVIANQTISLRIRIERDGAPVTNAIIRIEPPGGFQTFLTGEALDPSLYTGNYFNYDLMQTRIQIGSDDDAVPQTTIVGQDLFKINAPTAGQSVLPGVDLVANWSRPGAAASSLRVTTEGGYDSGSLPDSDTHTIPGASLSKVTASDEVFVLRCRRTDTFPGDASDGSFLDFCVQSRRTITVETP